ncbi:peptide-methionine (S)-S-oxide reductase [Pseudoalteromonas luteoviolacea]|uniref:peptide-methionine (S)-S-oxide reductase n=1 Tax=Pseudoalteromonas luteoviolacea TaxID=43657 RepID=UPI001B380C55|nr:peptide-methionine (S)-S-oxide reductase [Pseudoalteromonas luteoviolacea]MBQ4812442.1 peptide-methionine (S)-S-oxide reductase [Pseudoalteromonas luteoviolacea]
MINKLGVGGSCYWCTEAIFTSLNGVIKVTQGWVNSIGDQSGFSEGILIEFDTEIITLCDLIEIHLHTHSSTSNHSRRDKYRSAVYCFDELQKQSAEECLDLLGKGFEEQIITQALIFNEFKASAAHYQNYFYTEPSRPFCKNIITPKLKKLLEQFGEKVDEVKVKKALY